jgi:hypothetical protein
VSRKTEINIQKRNTNALTGLLCFIGILFLGGTLYLGLEAISYIQKEKNIATISEIKTINAVGKRIYSGEGGERKTSLSPELPVTQYIAVFKFEIPLGKQIEKDIEIKTIEGHNQPTNLSPLKVGDKIPIHYWSKSPDEFSQTTPKSIVLNFFIALVFSSLWFVWAYFAKMQNYKGMKIMFVLYAGILGGSFWNSMPGCEKRYRIISADKTPTETITAPNRHKTEKNL